MVDICISFAAKLAEYTVAPVLRQFGYLIYYKSNVEDLTQKLASLTDQRNGVQILVNRAHRNSEIILPQVTNWLDRVEKALREKETDFQEVDVAKATICCPNLKVRHSLSRKATKMAPKVDVLLTEGNFTTISCPAPAPKIEYPSIPYVDDSPEAPSKQPHEGSGASNPTNPPAPMDLSERLEYRLPYTKALLKALQDDKINMIGISGIIREIDTVTTKEFIKRMKHRNFFEEVVMAVVSQQDPDLKRIQGEIADMLDLKLENGSLVERAQRLRAAMSAILDSKRLLLILADVRQVLDLASIGISSGDGNKRCKIILISQLENVFGEMTTRTNFELLLQSTPGDRAVEFESRISVIRDVMDALTDDESNPIVLCAVYITSEESTQKKNDELKKRIVLRQRVELNGWPMNEESSCTSLATSTDGHTELLLLGSKSRYGDIQLPATIFNGMEDLKVLSIAWKISYGPRFYNLILPSLPLLKNLQTLILLGCDHLNLDAIGELRTLMILDLRGSNIQQLPDTFKNLSNLRLLDLTKCEVLKTIAPGVISSLSRLEELYMWDSFQDWVVEKLASTETTNWISQLEERAEQEEVDMWKRFNRLAVASISQLEDEERNESEDVSQLEDEESSEPEDVNDLGRLYEHTKWANSMDWTVGILSELLSSLSHLTTLQVFLPPVDILLRTNKLFHKLERFKISIGWKHLSFEDVEDYENNLRVDYENYLRVADLDASSLAGTGISLLLKKTNALMLRLKNLTDPLNIFDCANLEYLEVADCDALEYLIDMTSLMEHTLFNIFPVLNYLHIYRGSRLKEIFHGDLPQGSLQKLKCLELWNLPALTYVWKVESQSGCVGNLAHVEEIKIGYCRSLEAIFGLVGSGHHEEEAALEINFLGLTYLHLGDLPSSFTWISNSNYKGLARLPEVGSLYPNSLTVGHALFFDPKVYFPVLRSLRIIGLGNLKEIWNSQCSPNSFCELICLEVRNCDKLLHLVPTHMQNRLQKLEAISVFSCSSLEEIFEVRRLNVNEGDASTISQSKKIPSSISQPDQGMQINNIMDFKQSRPGFQNLTRLWVTDCHSLRYLLSPSIARGLMRLENLSIWDCEKIEEIVAAAEGEEKEDESILPRLKYLELWDLPNLRSFSKGKYTFDWPLVQIHIKKCDKMNNFCSRSLSIPRKVYITVRDCGENLEQELNNCRKEI
ncbi:hypothetical protein M0R45_010060 [Rubus argutus]|uniref:Uncharacterized protein n=1 Tax=Rubus argutus TaxID=59490 RepID=A0AAW1Y6W2_RUBAR